MNFLAVHVLSMLIVVAMDIEEDVIEMYSIRKGAAILIKRSNLAYLPTAIAPYSGTSFITMSASKIDIWDGLSDLPATWYTSDDDSKLQVPYSNIIQKSVRGVFQPYPLLENSYGKDAGSVVAWAFEPTSSARRRRVVLNLRTCHISSQIDTGSVLVPSSMSNNLLRNSMLWAVGIQPSTLSLDQHSGLQEAPEYVGSALTPLMTGGAGVYADAAWEIRDDIGDLLDMLGGGIALPADMLQANIHSPIFFENADVPVYVIDLADGSQVIRFGEFIGTGADAIATRLSPAGVTGVLASDYTDVQRWWQNVDDWGAGDEGESLAEILDLRTDRIGPPQPQDLPMTINPARFLLTNILPPDMLYVVVDTTKFPRDTPAEAMVAALPHDQLRKVLPTSADYVVLFRSGIPEVTKYVGHPQYNPNWEDLI